MDFELFGDMADRITEELPAEFFEELSGGVILDRRNKRHSLSRPDRPLYIMGEYCRDNTGRYILIYYGSFERVYGYLTDGELEGKLRSTIRHEFRHHMEYRAGVRDLEKEDEEQLWGYCLNTDIDDAD